METRVLSGKSGKPAAQKRPKVAPLGEGAPDTYHRDDVWYLADETEAHGPFCGDELRRLLTSGQLDLDHPIWREGFDDWFAIRDVPEFREDAESAIPFAPTMAVRVPKLFADSDRQGSKARKLTLEEIAAKQWDVTRSAVVDSAPESPAKDADTPVSISESAVTHVDFDPKPVLAAQVDAAPAAVGRPMVRGKMSYAVAYFLEICRDVLYVLEESYERVSRAITRFVSRFKP